MNTTSSNREDQKQAKNIPLKLTFNKVHRIIKVIRSENCGKNWMDRFQNYVRIKNTSF